MILIGKTSGPSGRLLAKHWEEQTGYSPILRKRASDCRRENREILVRFGNSSRLRESDRWRDKSPNQPEALFFLVDKFRVAEALLREGFVAPKFYTGDSLPTKEDFPLFIRTTLFEYKGRGMIPCETMEEFLEYWKHYYWWCSYIPVETEYRFYIFNQPNEDRCIFRASKKILRSGRTDNNKLKIRHNDLYKFSRRLAPYKQMPQICREVEKAAACLPGVFYALDIGWSPALNRVVIYEANTAFGLDNGSARQLVELLVKYHNTN